MASVPTYSPRSPRISLRKYWSPYLWKISVSGFLLTSSVDVIRVVALTSSVPLPATDCNHAAVRDGLITYVPAGSKRWPTVKSNGIVACCRLCAKTPMGAIRLDSG